MEFRTDNNTTHNTTSTAIPTTSTIHISPPQLSAPPPASSPRGPSSSSSSADSQRTEPVRSRWTPKPEQILILESIFNSGMVNPPKEETIRIRKLLEKFGAVGDANVFYWFQNRRSRSRRRQRQLQATLAAAAAAAGTVVPSPPPGHHNTQLLAQACGSSSSTCGSNFLGLNDIHDYSNMMSGANNNSNSQHQHQQQQQMVVVPASSSAISSTLFGDSDSGGGLFPISNTNTSATNPHQMDSTPQSSVMCSPLDNPNLGFLQTVPAPGGIITVFVNGVATQVPAGPFDMKAMFGEDMIVVHQTGIPVPLNEFGISSMQHGESYFLVPRFD